jgi:hypothetical protein
MPCAAASLKDTATRHCDRCHRSIFSGAAAIEVHTHSCSLQGYSTEHGADVMEPAATSVGAALRTSSSRAARRASRSLWTRSSSVRSAISCAWYLRCTTQHNKHKFAQHSTAQHGTDHFWGGGGLLHVDMFAHNKSGIAYQNREPTARDHC